MQRVTEIRREKTATELQNIIAKTNKKAACTFSPKKANNLRKIDDVIRL